MRSITSGLAGSYRFALLAGAGAAAISAPGVALAQDADDLASQLGDDYSITVIIVTASTREQTLQ